MKKVLFIDTSQRDIVTIAVNGEKVQSISQKKKAQETLLLLEKLLRKTSTKLSDISEIKVNVGPGSFTGLRVGVAIANALGFALDIPVNGQKVTQRVVVPRYRKKEDL